MFTAAIRLILTELFYVEEFPYYFLTEGQKRPKTTLPQHALFQVIIKLSLTLLFIFS